MFYFQLFYLISINKLKIIDALKNYEQKVSVLFFCYWYFENEFYVNYGKFKSNSMEKNWKNI